MKKLLFFTLYILSLQSFMYSDASNFKSLSLEDSDKFDKLYENYFAGKQLSIIYIDLDDCINCNLAFNFILRYNYSETSNILIQIKQLPLTKVEAFRKRYGINPNIKIIVSDTLLNNLLEQNLFKKNNYRSCAIQYAKGTPALIFKELIAFNNIDVVKGFYSGVSPINERFFQEDNLFYSDFKQVDLHKNFIYMLTAPNSSILLFDSNLQFKKSTQLSDTFLINTASSSILGRFESNIRNDTNNSLNNIIKNYNVDIKPLGYDMLQINKLIYRDSIIYGLGSIAIPVTTSFEKITFGGQAFVFKFDLDLNIIEIIPYQSSDLNNMYPIDYYGANVNENNLSVVMAKLNAKFVENYFIGNWQYKNKKYDFISIDTTVKLETNYTLSSFYKVYNEQVYHYQTLNDSIFYFRNTPYLLLRNKLICTLSDSINHFRYRNYVMHKNMDYELLAIERFANGIYFSRFDLNNKRTKVQLLNVPEIVKNPFFFIKNNNVILISLTSKGVIKYEYQLN